MDVYVYQASMLCADCGLARREQLTVAGKAPLNPLQENTYDSDDYPKGPFPDGGGEADCPQHCDECGLFLENPLTDDGVKYVIEQIRATLTGALYGKVVLDWVRFYGMHATVEDLVREITK